METNQLTEEQLKVAFCEVRKAHRLIYEYQRRMQDLTWFIKNKLGFNVYEGYKKFSDPLKSSNKIGVHYCSWNWIYTYVFEYYLGENADEDNSWRLYVIQISDTGYYKNKEKGSSKTNLSSYASPEESESRLLFYLAVAPNSAEEYDEDVDGIIESCAESAEFDKEDVKIIKNPQKQGYVQIAYSVPLSRFVDETKTIEILHDFVRLCNDNTDISLSIQE